MFSENGTQHGELQTVSQNLATTEFPDFSETEEISKLLVFINNTSIQLIF